MDEASRLLALKACRVCLLEELSARIGPLYAEFTGLGLEVVWRSGLNDSSLHGPHTACVLATRSRAMASQPCRACRTCLRVHWEPGDCPDTHGYEFTSPCGLTTFWLDLEVEGLCPARLITQARVSSKGAPALRRRNPKRRDGGKNAGKSFKTQLVRPPDCTVSQGGCSGSSGDLIPMNRGCPACSVSITGKAFSRAVKFLEFAKRELEAVARAELLERRLSVVESTLRSVKIEDGRLRRELHRRIPGLPETVPPPQPGCRARNVIQRVIDYIHRHFNKPIALGKLADLLGLNPSYLSALFARETGITFHRYLDEFRLAKAKELLLDPRNRVCEVACAVGYASDNWFRHAFKHHTGLSPTAWRGSAS
jgi:AraC-like DNA-binding protein